MGQSTSYFFETQFLHLYNEYSLIVAMRFQWTRYMGPSTQQTVAVVLIVSTQEVRGVAGKTSRALVYCT